MAISFHDMEVPYVAWAAAVCEQLGVDRCGSRAEYVDGFLDNGKELAAREWDEAENTLWRCMGAMLESGGITVTLYRYPKDTGMLGDTWADGTIDWRVVQEPPDET